MLVRVQLRLDKSHLALRELNQLRLSAVLKVAKRVY